MKRHFGRELLWLSLPILLLCTPSVWIFARQRYFDGPPVSLKSGVPRLELGRWTRQKPTAVDFARGISSRWVVKIWNSGACPASKRLILNGPRYPQHLKLAYLRNGKWLEIKIPHPQSEIDSVNFPGKSELRETEMHLGLPMDLVPKDATEVRLRGYLEGWMNCGLANSIATKSRPLDLVLKARNEPWPRYKGARVSPLKFRNARMTVEHFSSTPTRPIAHSVHVVDATFSYAGKFKNRYAKSPRSWVTDAQGKPLFYPYTSNTFDVSQGKALMEWRFNDPIPKEKLVFLHSWVCVDENEWPVRVKIPLTVR